MTTDTARPDSALSVRNLGASLAFLLLASLLTTMWAFGSVYYRDLAVRDLRQAQSQLSESRGRLARVQEDEQEIRVKIDRYNDLINSGRTEPERRLNWVETLRSIKEQRRLLRMDYEIAPQRPLDAKTAASGGYSFLVSPMKLDMALLHENDLLGLLADLSARVKALVSPRQCILERLPPMAQSTSTATLKAQCDVDWITLQEKL